MSERQADDMERVSLRVPAGLLDDVDALVDEGRYVNRSEAVREGLRELVRHGDLSLSCEDCGGELIADHGSADTIVFQCEDCGKPAIERT